MMTASREYAVAGSQDLPSVMEFVLQYSGPLPPSSGSGRKSRKAVAAAKHTIRRFFHSQLKNLWHIHPVLVPVTQEMVEIYSGGHVYDAPKLDVISWNYHRGYTYRFVPLVRRELALACRLRVDLLSETEPGAVIHGGDIDNRLKTLLDALTVPSVDQMKRAGREASDDEKPFFALMEDDALVLHIDTRSHRLLRPLREGEDRRTVDLWIKVEVVKLRNTESNAGFELP